MGSNQKGSGEGGRRTYVITHACYQPLRKSYRFKSRTTGGEPCVISSIRQSHAAKQLLKTGFGVKSIVVRSDFQVDHGLIMFLVSLL